MKTLSSNDLFAPHPLIPYGGVNPPYAPYYPHEWSADCHRVDVVAAINTDAVDALLESTPFTRAGDRLVFRYAAMREHTLALEAGGFIETMVCAPVTYKGLRTYTYIWHYTDNEIANVAGRELLGYSKKNATTTFDQHADGSVTGSTTLRTGESITQFSFNPDSDAPVVPVTDEKHEGSIHVRRLPYPDRLGDAYADVIYRRYRFAEPASQPGRAELNVEFVASDQLAALEPKVLGASYIHASFGGSLGSEVRGVLEVLTTPECTDVASVESELNTKAGE